MNNTATATAKETVRRPAPAAPSSAGRMTRRVGNTTYRVTLHFKCPLYCGRKIGYTVIATNELAV